MPRRCSPPLAPPRPGPRFFGAPRPLTRRETDPPSAPPRWAGVRAWWQGLDVVAQDGLIAAVVVPFVIGPLVYASLVLGFVL